MSDRRKRPPATNAAAPRPPLARPFTGRIARALIGILLTPAIVGLASALLHATASVPTASTVLSLDTGVFAFLAGFGAFSLVYVFLLRPTRAYIWGHELTHGLFAFLHGGRARGIDVKSDHGSILISRTSTLTLLAPYFFPFYTVALIAILALVSLRFPIARFQNANMALIGLSWGFHFCFTLNSLLQHQTDLERCGFVFSYALIVLLNVAVLALGLVVATPLTADQFAALWREQTLRAYAELGATVLRGHDYLWSLRRP